MKKNKGFTLVEMLVVVLIIGILVVIAVPQYQKAVLKANLHKGVSLVESIYQAQQAYFLAHGDFATDLTDLDITIPKDDSCDPAKTTFPLSYTCSWGRLYSNENLRNIYFLPNQDIAYVKFFKDDDTEGVDFEAGKRYCYARPYKPTAISVCENMGATYIGELPDIWKFYALD